MNRRGRDETLLLGAATMRPVIVDRARKLGIGVHEMKTYVAREDVEQWEPLINWLEKPGANEAPSPAPVTVSA